MAPDLKYLLFSVVLCFVQVLIAAALANNQVGLTTLAGNREGMPELTGMAGRAWRAHRNMVENLVLFAALVLTAQVTGKLDATTALGAQLFFWARLAYVAVYVIGLPWVRTAVWAVSIVGLVLIFIRVV